MKKNREKDYYFEKLDSMNNQLFIVCPFSNMENYLKKKYGNDSYFLTTSIGILLDEDFEYASAIKQFVSREKIKTIYFVNDTSCRFINGIIQRKKLYGLKSEKLIEELYIDNYISCFKDQSIINQKYKLAEINVKNQINTILDSSLLGSYISEYEIEVKGLITSKELRKYNEIQIETKNIIYEF